MPTDERGDWTGCHRHVPHPTASWYVNCSEPVVTDEPKKMCAKHLADHQKDIDRRERLRRLVGA